MLTSEDILAEDFVETRQINKADLDGNCLDEIETNIAINTNYYDGNGRFDQMFLGIILFKKHKEFKYLSYIDTLLS